MVKKAVKKPVVKKTSAKPIARAKVRTKAALRGVRKIAKKATKTSVVARPSPQAKVIPITKSSHTPRRQIAEDRRAGVIAWIVPVALCAAAVAALWHDKTSHHEMTAATEQHEVVAVSSAHLSDLFEKAAPLSLPDRVAFWSEHLYKDPQLLTALGQGPSINDTAPIFPPKFDCTTFVETVGGLARSHDPEELADQIIAIRYKQGQVSYGTRNHFPEADWIPNNESSGVIHDITMNLARDSGLVAHFAHKDIDKAAWFRAQGTADRVIASQTEPVAVSLPYIPIDDIMNVITKAPQGAIINVVRMDRARYPVLVSHQALLIWKNGEPFLRHASRDEAIREVPLTHYVEQMKHMPWKVLGFNINAFQG